VVAPHGEPDAGLVAIARPWDAGTPPPAEIASHPLDLLLLVESGRTIRIATQGAGNAVIDARGTGQVQLGGESGLSNCARQGDSVGVTLSTLQTSLDARYMLNPGPPVPLASPVTGTITSGSTKVQVK